MSASVDEGLGRDGANVIFLTLAGSQAHGTARATSDVDIRGVCVVPIEARVSLRAPFEQHEGALPEALAMRVRPALEAHGTARAGLGVKLECAIFDVAKFLGLCATANPNALEILFADERDWLLDSSRWRLLHAERQQFLTQKARHTFVGYAMAQLKRIKTHRSWLLSPPSSKPRRADFGLPDEGSLLSADDQNRIEEAIAAKLRSFRMDEVDMPADARIAVQERLERFLRDSQGVAEEQHEEHLRDVATKALHLPQEVVVVLTAEKRYRAALKHWESYETWKRQRNPARALLEAQHGYDTKHAMHLLRLMRMGLELLETGQLRVRRPDAAELWAIRDGALSFEALLGLATQTLDDIERAAAVSRLPATTDPERVDSLLRAVVLESR